MTSANTQSQGVSQPAAEPLDFGRLEALAESLRDEFRGARPFPHVVIEEFLPQATADRVRAEFEETREGWDLYHHYNENKLAVSSLDPLGPHTRALFDALQSRRFVDLVERLTGIEDLVSDPDLDGAGLHKIEPGGFLNVHTDFLAHGKNRTWSRQVNLLLYFNRGWRPEWNGDLELWDADVTRCERSIAPLFNRCVLFHTAEKSYHGHPHRLACPEGETRKSIALYYFRDEGAARAVSSTHYHALPGDPLLKRWLVAADRGLLRAYSIAKRYTGLSNQLASRILKRF
ncbi:MAG TPA: 2OG-Fe(II) oxygenase [Myxococcota bacterium]|jgi:Rps23 Pro-64 3,4-dihydroxylase Tpa1-like proline 4-hydroxylase